MHTQARGANVTINDVVHYWLIDLSKSALRDEFDHKFYC